MTAWAAPGSDEPSAAADRFAGTAPAPGAADGRLADLALRPRTVSETLDGAFVALRAVPGPTVGLAVIAGAVIETLSTVVAIAAQDTSVTFYLLLRLVTGALRLMMVSVLAGVVAVVLAEAGLGHRLTLAEAVRRVAPRLPGLLAITVLVMLVLVVGLVSMGIVSLWLGVAFCLAAPVYAVEGGTVLGALRRSRALVSRAWWRTFWLLLLTQVVVGLLGLVVAVPELLALSIGSAFTNSSGTPTSAGYVLDALVSLVLVALVVPVQAGVAAVLYLDRRVRREALDLALARARPEDRPRLLADGAAPAVPVPATALGPVVPGWRQA